MKQIFLILISLFCVSLKSRAGDWLDTPLSYIPGDSISVWSYDGRDIRWRALTYAPDEWRERLAESMTGSMTQQITPRLLDARKEILSLWQEMTPHFNIVGGGDDPFRESQVVPAIAGLNLASTLYLLTSDGRYMDYIERAYFNALGRIFYSQTDSTINIHDRISIAAAFMKFPQYLYAVDKENSTIYINLYINATAHFNIAGEHFMLDQITHMPQDGGVRFRFTGLRQPMRLRLRLRIPDWIRGGQLGHMPYRFTNRLLPTLKVYINGREPDSLIPDSLGYLTIDRIWRNGDETYLTLPLTPQYVRYCSDKGGEILHSKVALQCGPLVEVVTTPTTIPYVSVHDTLTIADDNSTGNPNINGYTYRLNTNSTQGHQATKIPFTASPYIDGVTGSLWLTERH